MKKLTFAVIVGNRGFFPDALAKQGRKDILAVLKENGYNSVALSMQETKYGAVETFDDAAARKGWCLYKVGCKGPATFAPCPIFQWNSGTNWCIGANAICLGCTEDGFPDKFSPFYKIEYGYQTDDKPFEVGPL